MTAVMVGDDGCGRHRGLYVGKGERIAVVCLGCRGHPCLPSIRTGSWMVNRDNSTTPSLMGSGLTK
jgi:hypothetical protein